MSAAPFFSILMPTHERPVLLERALQSLRAQTFADFEIIVVADAWDAETAAVAARFLGAADVFLKRKGPGGPARSRNAGLDLAGGEWLLFLDDDDTFAPHHLQALREQILARPQAHLLFTDCSIVTEDRSMPGIPALDRVEMPLTDNPVQALWTKNFIPIHALAYRRNSLEGSLFEPCMASLEDWDFLLSVCSRVGLPEPWRGGGVVMHKDFANAGNRRGTQESSRNNLVLFDFLYVYRRWPAPLPDSKETRQNLLNQVGLQLPLDWF